jgi:hypothetical protein
MNRLYSSIYIPVFKWLISINNISADKYLGKKRFLILKQQKTISLYIFPGKKV